MHVSSFKAFPFFSLTVFFCPLLSVFWVGPCSVFHFRTFKDGYLCFSPGVQLSSPSTRRFPPRVFVPTSHRISFLVALFSVNGTLFSSQVRLQSSLLTWLFAAIKPSFSLLELSFFAAFFLSLGRVWATRKLRRSSRQSVLLVFFYFPCVLRVV